MKNFYLKQITFLFFAILGVSSAWGQKLGEWNFNALPGGSGNFGGVSLAPDSTNTNVTVGALTRGAGMLQSGTGAAHAWGGSGFITANNNETAAITAGQYATFSFTAAPGFALSISGIDSINIRRSGTGPATGIFQYQVGSSGTFTDIGSAITWGAITTSAGNHVGAIVLSGIPALQNIAAGTTVTFRVVLWGSTGTAGTWYFNAGTGATPVDLIVTGTAASSGSAPVIGTNPSDVSVCSGSPAIFTVAATGTPTPTYQWQRSTTGTGGTFINIDNTTDGGIYTNYTTDTLNIATPPTSINGYAYQAVVTSAANNATSTAATITVSADTWQGGTGDWNVAGNWSCGIPTATTDVLISSGNPTITSATDNAASLNIASGALVSVNTGSILNVGGTVVNNGTINGSGSVVLNSTAAQTISGIGMMNNLQVSNAAGVSITLGDTVSIINTLTMTAGTLTTNGGLILVSNASGTASIPTITGGSITGNVQVQQYIAGGKRAFRFLGHPFSAAIPLSQLENSIDVTGAGGSTNGFTQTGSNNPSAFWYNPTTGNGSTQNDSTGWMPFTSTDGTNSNAWNPYEGIRVLVRGTQGQGLDGNTYTPNPVTLNMSGPVNQGPINMTMHVGANSGYNLFSNPYPSSTDIGTVINNAAGSMNGVGFYVWNANMPLGGGYETQIIGNVYSLPANASFVVDAATDGSTLTFAESNKSAAATEGLLRTTTLSNSMTLHLYDTSFTTWDRLYLSFNANAADSLEKNDAKKLHNSGLDFYSLSSNGHELAVDARPYVNGQVIPLGITTGVQQTYIIKAEDFTLPAGIQVYLHDKYLNINQQLQGGTQYTFTITSDTASQGNNRFELNTIGVSTGVANVNNNDLNLSIAPNPATDQVNIAYQAHTIGKTIVKVTNVLGQEIMNMDLGQQQSGNVNVPLHNIAAGVYIVTLTSGNQTVTKRLIKQ